MSAQRAVASLVSGNILVTGANLLRDITIASILGATAIADRFFLVISIPVFLITIAAGSFRSMSVPILERVGQQSREKALTLGTLLMARGARGIVLAALLLCAFAAVGAGLDVYFAALFLSIVPMFALSAYVEFSQGPLQIVDRYLVPAVLKVGLPLGMVAGLGLFAQHWDVFAASLGGFVGAGLAAVCAFILLRKSGLDRRMSPVGGTPELGWAGNNFKALIVATSITYANPLIDQWVGSLAGPGAVAQLGYANRVAVGIASLAAGSIAPVLLSGLSKRVGMGDHRGIRNLYLLAVSVGAWAGALASLRFWVFGSVLVDILYVRGAFTPANGEVVTRLIALYSLQYPFYWASVAAYSYISAETLNRFLVVLGVTLFVVNLGADIALLKAFGVYGIALSTVIVYGVSLVIMNGFLAYKRLIALVWKDVGRVLVPVLTLVVTIAFLERNSFVGAGDNLNVGAVGAWCAFAAIAMWTVLRRYQQYRMAEADRA